MLSDSGPFAIRLTWVILICIPSTWLLISESAKVGSLSSTGSVAAAAWVQAIGSVLAIVGAGVFPYFHEAKKDRDRRERLRRVMLLLAKNQKEQLRLLRSTLLKAVHDFGVDSINPYRSKQCHMKWPPHIEALKSIPLSELSPEQIYMLNEMKVGSDFAWSVCSQLDNWDVIGDMEQVAIEQLKHYLEMASLAVELLEKRPNPVVLTRR